MRRVLTFLLLLSTAGAHAAAPERMTLQGRIISTSGTAVDGTFGLRVSLYDGKDAQDALHEEDFKAVVVSKGLINLSLGSVTALDLGALSAADSVWVGIKVEGDPELPRKPLSSESQTRTGAQMKSPAQRSVYLMHSILMLSWSASNRSCSRPALTIAMMPCPHIVL